MVIKHAKEEMTIEDFKKKYPHMIKEDVAQGSDADMQKGSTLARDYFWAQKLAQKICKSNNVLKCVKKWKATLLLLLYLTAQNDNQ